MIKKKMKRIRIVRFVDIINDVVVSIVNDAPHLLTDDVLSVNREMISVLVMAFNRMIEKRSSDDTLIVIRSCNPNDNWRCSQRNSLSFIYMPTWFDVDHKAFELLCNVLWERVCKLKYILSLEDEYLDSEDIITIIHENVLPFFRVDVEPRFDNIITDGNDVFDRSVDIESKYQTVVKMKLESKQIISY